MGFGEYSIGGIVLTPVAFIQIIVAGVDRLGMVRQTSIQRKTGMGERTTLSFEWIDSTNTYEPLVGQEVYFYISSSLLFRGTIERLDQGPIFGTSGDTTGNAIVVECVDSVQILDRRLLLQNYETPGQTAGDIVKDLVNQLADEGIQPGTISDGVAVTKAIFPYVSFTKAMNDLADLCGVAWWIDSYKNLNFIERSTSLAPFIIDDTNQPFKNFQRHTSREQTKNRIYLQAGQARTDIQTENFAGDAQRRTFTVGYPVASVPTIQTNLGAGFVTRTVGIRGASTGMNFYWQKDSNEITQDTSGTVLTGTDILRVIYEGFFPLVLQGESLPSIAERKAVEGPTGLYEQLEQDADIDDLNLAIEKLTTLLRKFASLEFTISFETFSRGLAVGQVLTVDLTDERVSDDYLITGAVNRVDLSPEGAIMMSDITAVAGEFIGGWLDFFRKLEARGKHFAIRENDVLALGPTAFDLVDMSDTIVDSTPLDDGTNDPYSGLRILGDADATPEIRNFDLVGIGGPDVQDVAG